MDAPFEWTPWNCGIRVSANSNGEWQASYCGGDAIATVAGDQLSVVIPRSGLGEARRIRYAVVTQDNTRTSVFKTAGNFVLDLGADSEYASQRDLSSVSGVIWPGPVWESFHHRWIDPDTSKFTKKYFETFQDTADFLVVFTAFPYDNTEIGGSLSGAGNQIGGINLPIAPAGAAVYGSRSRLQAVVNPIMLSAPFHAESGTDIAGPWTGHDRSMWLLTHEIGHRWGMLAEYADGGVKRPLWEPGNHWSSQLSTPSAFPLRSELEASPMGGYRWSGNTDGTWTAAYQGHFIPSGYSWLDLYLMGLAGADEVPDMQWIDGLEWIGGRNGFQLGRGRAKNISIQQIVEAMGPRTPRASTSQTSFNTAFMLLTDSAAEVPSRLLDRIDGIRQAWMRQFLRATGGRATMNAEIRAKEDLRPSAGPVIISAGVTNAASFRSGIAPGGLVTIFGTNLSVGLAGVTNADRTPWPTSLAGTQVLMDGIAVPIGSIVKVNEQEQVTVQVPFSLDGNTWLRVAVVTAAGSSDAISVPVGRAHVGIFLIDGVNGAILRGVDNRVVTPANPAMKGDAVVIFATGLGATVNAPPAGVPAPESPLAETLRKPIVMMGGTGALVLFSGLSPGFIGLYQINAVVPENVASGSIDVTVSIDDARSNAAKMQVQ